MTAPNLIGRDMEIARLEEAVRGLEEGGGAIVIGGDAGIGKTSLLEAVAAVARSKGYAVYRATGVESEANLPFAGLHQLVRPALQRAGTLPPPQRDALLTAVGVVEGEPPAIYLVGLATLNLLTDLASETPTVVLADDGQWLDGPSAEVLAFVGRRLESDRVLLVIGKRNGFETPFATARLPEVPLDRLTDDASARLLDARAPELSSGARSRVLAEAAGNPLALVELPAALRSRRSATQQRADGHLPLTDRLQEAFAARASTLPASTAMALLVTAIDDNGDLAEVLSATSRVLEVPVTIDDLEPAVAAGLITIDDPTIQFRHPLMRSAIEQSSSVARRHSAHRALAEELGADPDRRAWHRAASTVGTDDETASDLEAAARRARDRGATGIALAGMERAAGLTSAHGPRAARLLNAAELCFELGRADKVGRLVTEAESLGLDERDKGRAMWLHEAFDDGIPGDSGAVHRLVESADRAIELDDLGVAFDLLHAAGLRCWWADPGEEARRRILDAVERLPADRTDPRVLEIVGLVAPVDFYGPVSEGAAQALGRPADATSTRVFANAAHTVGDFATSLDLLARAIPLLRAQGRLALLAQALIVRAWDAIELGRFRESDRDSEEGLRLATETSQPIWVIGASIARAALAGVRGNQEVAERLTLEAEAILLPARLSDLLSVNQLARGLTALSAGRHGDAFDHLRRAFDPADVSFNPMELYGAVGYMAEAAVHASRQAEARKLIPELEALGRRTEAPVLHAGLRFARAILADDGEAEPLFRAALEADSGWPFHGARLRLAFGAWLRRHRRIAESRPYLRAARETFDGLGSGPWAERARQELRAAGERSPERAISVVQPLSPQELQIAEMAAEGLSNREIGERLFLSHRTVGSHLYRIFPKLGIASRSDLLDALAVERTAQA